VQVLCTCALATATIIGCQVVARLNGHVPGWLRTPAISFTGALWPERLLYVIGFFVVGCLFLNAGSRFYSWSAPLLEPRHQRRLKVAYAAAVGSFACLFGQAALPMQADALAWLYHGAPGAARPLSAVTIAHQCCAILFFLLAVVHAVLMLTIYRADGASPVALRWAQHHVAAARAGLAVGGSSTICDGVSAAKSTDLCIVKGAPAASPAALHAGTPEALLKRLLQRSGNIIYWSRDETSLPQRSMADHAALHPLTCPEPLRSLPSVFQKSVLWWRLKLLALLSVPLPALIWPLLHPATVGAWLAVDRSSPAAQNWGLPSPISAALPTALDSSTGSAARPSPGGSLSAALDMDSVTAMRRDALALGGLVQWCAVGAVIAYFATYARDFVVLEAAHEALAGARTLERGAGCSSGRAVAASLLAVPELQGDARLSDAHPAMLATAPDRTCENLHIKRSRHASRGSSVSRSRGARKTSKKER
jgi:hypothetical protein